MIQNMDGLAYPDHPSFAFRRPHKSASNVLIGYWFCFEFTKSINTAPSFLILYMRINKTSKRIERGKGSFGFGDPVETNGPISLIASQ